MRSRFLATAAGAFLFLTLLSLPYPFGPSLERAETCEPNARILWLIPITDQERRLALAAGLDALETRFEKQQYNYLDPHRPSVTDSEK